MPVEHTGGRSCRPAVRRRPAGPYRRRSNSSVVLPEHRGDRPCPCELITTVAPVKLLDVIGDRLATRHRSRAREPSARRGARRVPPHRPASSRRAGDDVGEPVDDGDDIELAVDGRCHPGTRPVRPTTRRRSHRSERRDAGTWRPPRSRVFTSIVASDRGTGHRVFGPRVLGPRGSVVRDGPRCGAAAARTWAGPCGAGAWASNSVVAAAKIRCDGHSNGASVASDVFCDAAHLPDVLASRGLDLLGGRTRFEPAQRGDVPAHDVDATARGRTPAARGGSVVDGMAVVPAGPARTRPRHDSRRVAWRAAGARSRAPGPRGCRR